MDMNELQDDWVSWRSWHMSSRFISLFWYKSWLAFQNSGCFFFMWLFSIDPFLYLWSQPWWWHLNISWKVCSPSWWAMSSVYEVKWRPHSLHLSKVCGSLKSLSLSESTSMSCQSRPTYCSISSTSKKSLLLSSWHGAESSLTNSNPPGISLTNSLSSRLWFSFLSWTDAFSNYYRDIIFSP